MSDPASRAETGVQRCIGCTVPSEPLPKWQVALIQLHQQKNSSGDELHFGNQAPRTPAWPPSGLP